MTTYSSTTELPEAFDPATHESGALDCVPPGTYAAYITEASVGTPKSGDGQMIHLSWKIAEGEFEGRWFFQNIIFLHSNGQAENIGRRMVKDLCVACDISEVVTDVAVFKDVPCAVTVDIRKDPEGVYSDQNRVRRIRPLAQAAKPAAPQPKGNGPGSAAWSSTKV
jgi:Protein of unknown function (DUF669)